MPRHKKHLEVVEDDRPAVSADPPEPAPDKPDGSITITYVGDPTRKGEGPDRSTFAGKLMPKGEPVTIDDPAWVAKFGFRFRRNKHFHVE